MDHEPNAGEESGKAPADRPLAPGLRRFLEKAMVLLFLALFPATGLFLIGLFVAPSYMPRVAGFIGLPMLAIFGCWILSIIGYAVLWMAEGYVQTGPRLLEVLVVGWALAAAASWPFFFPFTDAPGLQVFLAAAGPAGVLGASAWAWRTALVLEVTRPGPRVGLLVAAWFGLVAFLALPLFLGGLLAMAVSVREGMEPIYWVPAAAGAALVPGLPAMIIKLRADLVRRERHPLPHGRGSAGGVGGD